MNFEDLLEAVDIAIDVLYKFYERIDNNEEIFVIDVEEACNALEHVRDKLLEAQENINNDTASN